MNPEEILDYLADNSPDSMTADGLDTALIGWTYGTRCLAVYDSRKVIDLLVSRDGMTYEEAEEYFDFNIAGAYMGVFTPIFITIAQDEQ
jgi:hypothetical protein